MTPSLREGRSSSAWILSVAVLLLASIAVTLYATSRRDENAVGIKPAIDGTPPRTGGRAIPPQPAQSTGGGTSDVRRFGQNTRIIRQEEGPAQPQ